MGRDRRRDDVPIAQHMRPRQRQERCVIRDRALELQRGPRRTLWPCRTSGARWPGGTSRTRRTGNAIFWKNRTINDVIHLPAQGGGRDEMRTIIGKVGGVFGFESGAGLDRHYCQTRCGETIVVSSISATLRYWTPSVVPSTATVPLSEKVMPKCVRSAAGSKL